MDRFIRRLSLKPGDATQLDFVKSPPLPSNGHENQGAGNVNGHSFNDDEDSPRRPNSLFKSASSKKSIMSMDEPRSATFSSGSRNDIIDEEDTVASLMSAATFGKTSGGKKFKMQEQDQIGKSLEVFNEFDDFQTSEWSTCGLDWRINKFSEIIANIGAEAMESPIFGGRWKLKFFPNGNFLNKEYLNGQRDMVPTSPSSDGYCSVFVFPVQCQDESEASKINSGKWERKGIFTCYFGIKQVDGKGRPGQLIWKPRMTKETQFDGQRNGWGFSNLFTHKELRSMHRVSQTDTFVITCQIRTQDLPKRPFWQKDHLMPHELLRGLNQLTIEPAADVIIICAANPRNASSIVPPDHRMSFSPTTSNNLVYCHRAILAARCAFFERMFASGFVRGRFFKIAMDECDLPTVFGLIQWFYTGRVEFRHISEKQDNEYVESQNGYSGVSPFPTGSAVFGSDIAPEEMNIEVGSIRNRPRVPKPYALSMYILADKLKLEELRELALEFIRTNLRIATAFEDALEIDAWDELYLVVRSFVLRNWSQIRKTRGFERAMAYLEDYGEAGRRVAMDFLSSLEYLNYPPNDLVELRQGLQESLEKKPTAPFTNSINESLTSFAGSPAGSMFRPVDF